MFHSEQKKIGWMDRRRVCGPKLKKKGKVSETGRINKVLRPLSALQVVSKERREETE